ncbi:MAG TPA: S1 RNA-binding domain-containing protein [Phycisphaerae bacterium]|jgi:small subunit ribosomal protein S1|nr:S1 RNA-binding domain-containing protein [Phycisphaerae bacterium]HOB75300.1 S1 RNA-binding domain-containing protein [Phycisphaerae bacterium]HOJ53264.1 S1 RNA-binding domain-containing protein [Phycisphaerae bacterium]HOL25228.1 S1 RNA-binding domain-containing protein [Phycisphaerae bacterium]HPP20218.1 S1 RNA-binding domain-containing protein [Phycisphaerae bacterium]
MARQDKDLRVPKGGERNLDEALAQELEEALGGMSLMDMMDEEEAAARAMRSAASPTAKGVKRGQVLSVGPEDIFVDMGGKSTGVLPAAQFENEPLPAVGDWIEVTITGVDKKDNLLKLSRQGAVQAAAWESLEEGMIVEGRVTGHNKGGLELNIDGIKAFMPISQVERGRVEDLAPYVNQRLKCEVTDIRPDEKQIVVSRRNVLDREAEEEARRTFESLVEGQVVKGTVKTIMPYGAFVDIGGMDGLLHIKDMAFTRVEKPEDVVRTGQQIEVMILKIDRDTRKLSLGLKQVMPDPWNDADVKWPVDSIVTGRVTRLEGFGAFVELEPGVEGLVPISEMTFERRIKHPSEIVKAGDVIKVKVLKVDIAARRISLSIKQVGDDPWTGASARWPVDSVVTGTVKRLAEFGAFVELSPGVEGLIHISELSEQRVRVPADVVREGQQVTCKVLEVDEDRRRISLSIKRLKEDPNYTGETTNAPSAPEAPKPEKKRKKPLKGGLEW